MSEILTATFYAQIEPEWSSDWAKKQGQRPSKAVIRTITQGLPKKPIGGALTIKLSVEVNANLFMPLLPEAVIAVPGDLTEGTPVRVIALDPREPQDEG